MDLGFSSIFQSSSRNTFATEKIRIDKRMRSYQIVVAKDNSGDTDDIQEALKLVETGGEIYIKEGTYTIKSSLIVSKNNITISGTGYGTIIKTSQNIDLFSLNSIDNVLIQNLKLEHTATGNCVYMTTCSFCKIINCEVNFANNGIKATGNSYHILIQNCTGIGGASAYTFVYFDDCVASMVQNNVLNTVNDYFAYIINSSDDTFMSNTILAGSTMFYISTSLNLKFIANTFLGVAAGYDVDTSNCDFSVFIGNIFQNDGIYLNATSGSNTLIGNKSTITNLGAGNILANNG